MIYYTGSREDATSSGCLRACTTAAAVYSLLRAVACGGVSLKLYYMIQPGACALLFSHDGTTTWNNECNAHLFLAGCTYEVADHIVHNTDSKT